MNQDRRTGLQFPKPPQSVRHDIPARLAILADAGAKCAKFLAVRLLEVPIFLTKITDDRLDLRTLFDGERQLFRRLQPLPDG